MLTGILADFQEFLSSRGLPDEKHTSVHTLRHSFATHLLFNGVNIREYVKRSAKPAGLALRGWRKIATIKALPAYFKNFIL